MCLDVVLFLLVLHSLFLLGFQVYACKLLDIIPQVTFFFFLIFFLMPWFEFILTTLQVYSFFLLLCQIDHLSNKFFSSDILIFISRILIWLFFRISIDTLKIASLHPFFLFSYKFLYMLMFIFKTFCDCCY